MNQQEEVAKKEDSYSNEMEIIENPSILKFLLDTNVVLAYLNNKNPFHLEAKTSVDALRTRGFYFVISYITIGEFIAHRELIGNKNKSIQKGIEVLKRFDASLDKRLVGGPPMHLSVVIEYYKKHSRHSKLTKAGFSDFMILAQAHEIKNVRVLTCDKKMYDCGKTILRDKIYFLPNSTKGVRSDYPRLMSEIQNNFR